jgi:hypothetical protein
MKGKVFTAQEVQSIISGNKRMFREVIKPYPVLSDDKSYWEFKGVRWAGEKSSYAKNFGNNARPEMPDLCPYQVGQKIFCKEKFCRPFSNIYYQADSDCNEHLEWSSPSYMQKWASRLTLQIKEIRVEKLSEISEKDAIAEGMFFTDYGKKCYHNGYQNIKICPSIVGHENQEDGWNWKESKSPSECWGAAKYAFANYWNATHKKPEEKFEASPFVWVVTMEVVK